MMIRGKHLRLIRILNEIKQTEMAKKLQVSQQAYSALENQAWIIGEKCLKIIDALGYTPEEFEAAIIKLPPPLKENIKKFSNAILSIYKDNELLAKLR